MWFPWSNINHHQQETEESFIFGSENIFLNPVQKTNSSTCLNPPIAATGREMDSINVSSSLGAASQHWSLTAAVNTSLESLDCLLSATNSTADTSSDHDDGIVSQSSSEKKRKNSGFFEDNSPRSKKPRSDPGRSASSTINFRQGTESDEMDSEAIAQMKEMIYRAAAFRPVSFADDEVVEKPRRRNVRISSDPQTVAARQRREKISERIRVLQKLVPGGNKMDTASMLDEAANYLKFLRSQVKALEQFGQKLDYVSCGTTTNANSTSQMIQDIDPNVTTLGVPFPMQAHFLLPHQQL
ncbi:hypothetical protein L1987_52031 [Smallanthus sonchifolius]|uniref:Uncharacterized protein n=1 Tax=Smallanthus sonchifolius TaxID=185202 RepID=A0ACB9ES13_9ASTR|nr:hypothetical protein L1987_52031 [Smallanthus sonchifolius]